ncbi:MAG: Lrp/AsnC family transcriptional regulator [Pseudomonadota bacterium]
MAVNLSEGDVRILRLLQKDAARPRRELAEEAAMSATTLWRRVHDLEASGAIRRRVALLDPDKLGFPVCVLVQIDLANYERPTREAFERFVDAAPQIMQCFAMTGGNDYAMIVRARSVADFERFLTEHILAHPSVATASSQVALRQTKDETALPL